MAADIVTASMSGENVNPASATRPLDLMTVLLSHPANTAPIASQKQSCVFYGCIVVIVNVNWCTLFFIIIQHVLFCYDEYANDDVFEC